MPPFPFWIETEDWHIAGEPCRIVEEHCRFPEASTVAIRRLDIIPVTRIGDESPQNRPGLPVWGGTQVGSRLDPLAGMSAGGADTFTKQRRLSTVTDIWHTHREESGTSAPRHDPRQNHLYFALVLINKMGSGNIGSRILPSTLMSVRTQPSEH